MMKQMKHVRTLLAVMTLLFCMVLSLGSVIEIYAFGAAANGAPGKGYVSLARSRKKNKHKSAQTEASTEVQVEEDGTYTAKEEVAAYIHQYKCLPDNFITKKEAEALGWVSAQGNLDEVAPGKSIGGDRFGNYEEQLPIKKGRHYYECDIDFDGGYRGSKRIIYSDDGLIYYTDDHYETFTQLY